MTDRPMYSPDLFDPDVLQVFSVRTGDRIGYEQTETDSEVGSDEVRDEMQLSIEF